MPQKSCEESRGCFAPAVALVVLVFLFFWGFARSAEKVSLDFVDAPIRDVARSVSLAYGVPILVDGGVDARTTFHLDGVGLLEGLSSLCGSLGLEVVQEGSVFRIRNAEARGRNFFELNDSLVTVSVENRDIADFVRDFSANTGLNVVAAPGLSGKISGSLRAVTAEAALRILMETHGFRVRKDAGCFRVEERKRQASPDRDRPEVLVDGGLYSVDLDGAPMGNFLRELSRAAGLNLVLYGSIDERVNLRFERVPLDALLAAVFKGSKYAFVLDSNSLSVSEKGVRNVLASTEFYPLKHGNPEMVMPQLLKMMPNSNFVVTGVKEQNALMLGGAPSEIEMARSILEKLDVPALQVTLSCVIVEIKKGRSFEIGLHSGSGRKTGENDIGVRGFWDFLGKDFSASGAFGKIGVLPARFEMELASMEENNGAEVLARPRLTTLNGNKAELNVTNTVYYLVSQVSADGYPITDYRSFNDGISLELTPTVTMDGSITLNVSPEIKTAGRTTGDGPRDISTRNLKTTVVLRDGETLFLGGLVRKGKSEVRSAVPFLGSIPVVGRLFSYVSEENEESELAIFITPEVMR